MSRYEQWSLRKKRESDRKSYHKHRAKRLAAARRYSKERQRRLREAGSCLGNCGAKAMPNRTRCRDCAKRNAAGAAKRREEKRTS